MWCEWVFDSLQVLQFPLFWNAACEKNAGIIGSHVSTCCMAFSITGSVQKNSLIPRLPLHVSNYCEWWTLDPHNLTEVQRSSLTIIARGGGSPRTRLDESSFERRHILSHICTYTYTHVRANSFFQYYTTPISYLTYAYLWSCASCFVQLMKIFGSKPSGILFVCSCYDKVQCM